jgi:hypothetical protein
MVPNSNSRHLGVIAGAAACLLTITAVVLAVPGLRPAATVDRGAVRFARPAQVPDTRMEAPVPMREAFSSDLGQVGADESWWQRITADLTREEYAAT